MNDVETERWVRDSLQKAGRRPPLPASDLALAKAAAHQELLRLQHDRSHEGRGRRRSWVALAAALLVVVLAVWWWWRPSTSESRPTVARVEVVGGKDSALSVGRELVAGETITPELPLALRLSAGQSVRLAAKTELQIVDSSSLRLDRGRIYVDSGQLGGARGLRIETAFGTVSEIGTQFEVRVGDSKKPLRVRVREGQVVVEAGGGSHPLEAGEELLFHDDGSVRRRAVARFGTSWQWVQEIAPRLSGQTQSLSDYLGWIARETGYEIEFEDLKLEQSAQMIDIFDAGSSLEDLTPDQTLDVVLPGSGLSYRLSAGTLSIFRD